MIIKTNQINFIFREQTYNVWAKSMVSYQYEVATILELKPNPKKCPIIVRPRCLRDPNHFVDYNGCLFFICTDPPKQGMLQFSLINKSRKSYF